MKKTAKTRGRSATGSRGARELSLFRIPGLPEIRKGEDLAKQIVGAAKKSGLGFKDGDILVVAQKIISKAEGSVASLETVKPSEKAQKLAADLKKDPRAMELVLRESRRILRSERVLMGKSEGTPAVLVRGYRYKSATEKAASIIRPASEDLFR